MTFLILRYLDLVTDDTFSVHLVECISESHSAVDRQCHADVDELPYFGKHSEGERRASEAWAVELAQAVSKCVSPFHFQNPP
ncbi:hypothetical protein ROHU_030640 [Labeo rohita]|uniref:Uncharacterized protein n=1 Tax=Labeo rohita TaxID=84645 RepID=A0A498LQX6_LABRO|nr:hypothetical protein ROHU_030640 [Labeo rohita]